MSDLITSQMLSDWRANYGLDKRTPIKAMHWWQDNMDGKAPAGVVAALGLCINEIERLTAERDELRDLLLRAGFVQCDIPACNCGSWHHRYGLPERMQEIKDALAEAGHELSNANGNLPINALKALVAERDDLRRQLAEAEQEALRYRWLRPRFFAADFAYSDPPVCAIVFRWPESAKISANLDREIDAAMDLTRPAEEA